MVIKMLGWYGWSEWPGRGPFSYLPPWQRPGWLLSPWWGLSLTKEQELEILKNEMDFLNQQIERIKARIEELEKK